MPFVRLLTILVGFAVTLFTVPRIVAGRDAEAWFDGDLPTEDALASHVVHAMVEQHAPVLYATGESRFDAQSSVAFYQMALMGLGQVLMDHPEKREAYLPAMHLAAKRLVSPELFAYAARVYGDHGADRLGSSEGHAYLGYINLGLGMLRLVEPKNEFAKLNDRLTAELARNLETSPHGLIETYPGETWPPDVAAVAASIALQGTATGTDHAALLSRWAARFEACAVDRAGMLVQRVVSGTCKPMDAPRGSGTALASYFATFASPNLAARLYSGLKAESRSLAGFGAIHEYEAGYSGKGDLNAGPIVFGFSVGATGFGLGAARAMRDREGFGSLYRSTHLLGVPVTASDGTAFALGGPLGNALLLAMLTAREP